MGIHGIIYIVVGLGVTVLSSYVEGFIGFMILGIIFMGIGIVKLIMGRTKIDEPEINMGQYKKCPHCRAYNWPSEKLCHHCKQKLN